MKCKHTKVVHVVDGSSGHWECEWCGSERPDPGPKREEPHCTHQSINYVVDGSSGHWECTVCGQEL